MLLTLFRCKYLCVFVLSAKMKQNELQNSNIFRL